VKNTGEVLSTSVHDFVGQQYLKSYSNLGALDNPIGAKAEKYG